MTTEHIRSWLESTGKDRQWLADQIEAKKGSVDQWFSRGFPAWAVKSIERLMSAPSPGSLHIHLDAEQWSLVDAARRLSGYHDTATFARDVIIIKAREIASKGTDPTDVAPAAGEPHPAPHTPAKRAS